MNYNQLKQELYFQKVKIESIESSVLKEADLDKDSIESDLTQYFIFIEELENKIKKDPSIKKNDYKKQLGLIYKYLMTLKKILIEKKI